MRGVVGGTTVRCCLARARASCDTDHNQPRLARAHQANVANDLHGDPFQNHKSYLQGQTWPGVFRQELGLLKVGHHITS